MKKNRILCQVMALAVILFIMPACGILGQEKIENPLNWPVSNFSFIDQDGKGFGTNDLKGKVWVADFIFTNCTTVCSPMTAHMASLQKQLNEKKYNITFVSFSVDPKRDQPKTLREFGKRFNVDFSNWHFLTGYSDEEIAKFAEGSFKSAVMTDPKSDQVMHATSFFLVDSSGKIVKRYDGTDQKADQQLLKDIDILLKK